MMAFVNSVIQIGQFLFSAFVILAWMVLTLSVVIAISDKITRKASKRDEEEYSE